MTRDVKRQGSKKSYAFFLAHFYQLLFNAACLCQIVSELCSFLSINITLNINIYRSHSIMNLNYELYVTLINWNTNLEEVTAVMSDITLSSFLFP